MGTLTRNRLIRVLSICRNILENSKTWVENKYRWFKTVDFSKTKEFLTERNSKFMFSPYVENEFDLEMCNNRI